MLAKGFEAVDDKGQVGEVLLHFHSTAVGEVTQLDELVAFWSLEEHQLGSPWRLMASDFGEPKDLSVEINALFQIGDPVSCVVQSSDNRHNA